MLPPFGVVVVTPADDSVIRPSRAPPMRHALSPQRYNCGLKSNHRFNQQYVK